MILGAHLFGLPNVSQVGLELAAVVARVAMMAAVAAYLVSQCNVVWKSFLQARGSKCQSFDSPWCFIFTNVAPASQQGFGVTELALSGSAP
jgi:hypothetical protein